MENPYNNEQPYQPVPPQEPIPPTPSLYQGNNGFATASLVMGILSLVFLCCAPFLLLSCQAWEFFFPACQRVSVPAPALQKQVLRSLPAHWRLPVPF